MLDSKLYTPKNFGHLLGIEGFSDQLLKNHFSLYQGYVNNVNKIIEALNLMEKENKFGTLEYAELKRRFGWEFNGMRLHELYFSNMTKDKIMLDKESKIYKKIMNDFGSYEIFEKDFKSLSSIRGIGWVILSYDLESDRLFNTWINEHDIGHLTGSKPLLVLDVFEHAYTLDYGIKKADYIEAFYKVIDWRVVAERFIQRA